MTNEKSIYDMHDAVLPDLLAALKMCALEIANIHNRKLTADEQYALDAARAAIAKAEGR